MHTLFLCILALVIALLDASVRPWIPGIHTFPLIATVSVILLATQLGRSAYIWCTIVTIFLADMLLGSPLGARPALILAALVAVQPLVRIVRQQRGFLALAAIGITVATAERFGVMLDQHPAAVAAWWMSAALAWLAAVAWITVVAYCSLRFSRRSATLHVTTPI
ncbi:MAG: hypothetical protein Q8R16_04210 [bacterium]|nr:hypothetical protein [bacterium]